ncbi:DUF3597 domain-containing protein [Roseomonas hellenica]|uniref:DUF3597 domain-containing protein n=1 Tax=Plastoroseomonas hellenica TaxID=2687306 RepID=A0ABS5F9W8_9PROT|nr:DUF3597 domain-containing protein [Plastoroseomonas hellenica]MBR0669366.1 DUF3597 domain-containing protein [Plastoroseomonas hellenica]
MSIFRSIMSKIFGSDMAPVTAPQPGAPDPNASSAAAPAMPPPVPAAGGSTPVAPSAAAAAAGEPIDVEKMLTELAAQNGQGLNWRQSIVDLMKLLGLDSSLAARKELAAELRYPGDTNDSAAMNVWLHKRVMEKLAENGGKVPPDLIA